uniref:dienelactone hydrolase family protein n=1 Tax=Roseovarius indicus TaxID=540747 RepID=UPI003B52DBA4
MLLRLVALLSCLAGPALAESVSFPANSQYEGAPVTLDATLQGPSGPGPHPAVILMHGCGGLQPAVAEALDIHAKALNEAGFVTLILDSFGPRGIGGGHVCETYERLRKARSYRMQDAHDAKAFLLSQPQVDSANIFVMGQSNGGSVTIRLSQRETREFRALAAYYPWCGAFNRLGAKAELTTSLIVFGGDADDWVPPEDCTTITAEGADYAVHIYPGAAHSFDLQIPEQTFQGHLVGNNPEAETDSRAKMIAFFKSHLAGP